MSKFVSSSTDILFSSIGKNNYLYVLALTYNKFYIGKSINVMDRIARHKLGQGARWTKLWKFISVVSIVQSETVLDEDILTKKYMLVHSIANVRGGSYSAPKLSFPQLKILQMEFDTAMNKCFRCGGDFISNHQCNQNSSQPYCYYCGELGHRVKDCPIKNIC